MCRVVKSVGLSDGQVLYANINKRDTIFLNIKIIRVLIPLRTILHGYRDSEEFSKEKRLHRPNCEN